MLALPWLDIPYNFFSDNITSDDKFDMIQCSTMLLYFVFHFISPSDVVIPEIPSAGIMDVL
jgi:hypothetical protein